VLKFFIAAQLSAVEAARRLREREEGQTMAEYGVVLAVITLAVITAITLLSTRVQGAINNVAGLLPGEDQRTVTSPAGAGSFGSPPRDKQKVSRK
jgi:Flp pilus assembly pilin Flp